MTRITQNDLQALCNHINRATGNSEELYTRQPDGSLTANPGNYYLSGAYGGWNLCQMSNTGGGSRDVFSYGHIPKRELYAQMRAYLAGIEVRPCTPTTSDEGIN